MGATPDSGTSLAAPAASVTSVAAVAVFMETAVFVPGMRLW